MLRPYLRAVVTDNAQQKQLHPMLFCSWVLFSELPSVWVFTEAVVLSLWLFFKDLCFYLSTTDKDLHSRKTDYFNLNHIFLYSYCFNKSKSYFCTINHFREIRESGTKGHISSARSQYRAETSYDPKSTENHFKIDTTQFFQLAYVTSLEVL